MSEPHDDLIRTIQEGWAPEGPDPARFEAALRRRLLGQRRRRVALISVASAALAMVALSHLLGDPSTPGPILAPVAQDLGDAEPAVASAAAGAGVFFSEALEYERSGLDLPGAYGALDSLFLQEL
jgi:hypothetical protein